MPSFSEEEFDLDPELEGLEPEEVPNEQPEQGESQDPEATDSLPRSIMAGLSLAPRRGDAAVGWARGQHQDQGREWGAMCLSFVRQAFECPAGTPTASDAWNNAHFKHLTSDGNRAPRAAAFFWRGGSKGFGHVVITCGGGMCWSNDINVYGGISFVRINDITRKWGQQPMGWTQDLNGLKIWTPPPMPEVDLSNVREQFFAAKEHKRVHELNGVKRIQRALNVRYNAGLTVDGIVDKQTLDAYGHHEHTVGVSGRPRIPDMETLTKLGARRFKVIR